MHRDGHELFSTTSLDDLFTPKVGYTLLMLMVVFGAGASFDSCPTYPPGTQPLRNPDISNHHGRPPLANELFEDRPVFAGILERFPECAPIVPSLRHLKDNNLEAVLESLRNQAQDYPRRRRQLASVQCYIHQALSAAQQQWHQVSQGITNYKTLLDEIERLNGPGGAVCLVTFNYDTLLEDALRLFNLPITGLDDYTKNQTIYKVFKLHGSLDWVHKVQSDARFEMSGNSDQVLLQIIEHWDDVRLSDSFLFSPNDVAGQAKGAPTFPAIAIPVTTKQTYECPKAMVDELTALLPKVKRILTVGWRATEEHFLNLLRQRAEAVSRVHVVAKGLGEVEEIAGRIRKSLSNSDATRFSLTDEGFTNFMLGQRCEEILRPHDVPNQDWAGFSEP